MSSCSGVSLLILTEVIKCLLVFMKRLDIRAIPDKLFEIRCFFCGRNEAKRLPEFFSYHRRLGVNRFFYIDNGSTDESVEIALAEESVHVWTTNQLYQESCFGVDWQEALLYKYGTGYWCLLIDLDEFFYFPFCDQGRTFQDFITSLNRKGRILVKSMMLDMYSNKKIHETKLFPDVSIFNSCPYFDRPKYLWLFFRADFKLANFIYFQGVRQRVFSSSSIVRKYPLVRYMRSMRLRAGHHHLFVPFKYLARDRTFLFHFKFLSDFRDYTFDCIERKCHWNRSSEYQAYYNLISQHPNLNLYNSSVSVRYRDTNTFLQNRILQPVLRSFDF